MDASEYQRRIDEVKRRAQGHWTSILRRLGVGDDVLNGKNQPCPLAECGPAKRLEGGKLTNVDRFQYTDKFGRGDYHCRGCGPGDGFKLLERLLGMKFAEALREVEKQVGAGAPVESLAPGPSPAHMKALARAIWEEAKPVIAGDEVDLYLRRRGLALTAYPRSLRFHPALGYYEREPGKRSRKVGECGAMLACVQGEDGHAVTLHRTYLRHGLKAYGADSKKLLSSGINGAAVRLQEPTDELAVTEGIENGLAVHLSTGKPVWAGISCGNLEKLWVPDSVQRVCVYGDNDANGEFAGQLAAFTLARRLVKDARKRSLQRSVVVHLPRHGGVDWSDIWLARRTPSERAA